MRKKSTVRSGWSGKKALPALVRRRAFCLSIYTEGDGDSDGEADGDSDGEADGDSDGDGDADGDSDGEVDGDADGVPEMATQSRTAMRSDRLKAVRRTA